VEKKGRRSTEALARVRLLPSVKILICRQKFSGTITIRNKTMSNENQNLSQEIEALRKQRDALRKRLEQIEGDYKSGLSADSEERAVELENADVLDGIAKVTAVELAEVEEKLSRLEKM
jgi:predicted RNase H-like nuclease (RuvC/YqgF family)